MGQASLVSDSSRHSIVEVSEFRKSYRKQLAVDGVNIAVRRGELYGLLGPDGAGKSSLMKAIAGVMTFDSGNIDVFGTRLNSEAASETIKDLIGFMPQGLGLNLYPDLSVEENINFFARLRLVDEQELLERKQRLLAMTRLEKFRQRPMKQLSGGMKQKLGLICTLIHQPKLLILDEPTTGVDPVSRRDFWTILATLLHEQQITALVTTAYMDEASRFHHVSLMYAGQILAEGKPDQICAMIPGTTLMVQTDEQAKAIQLLRQHFSQVQPDGKWIRLFVDDMDADTAIDRVRTLLSALKLEAVQKVDTELEDAFVGLLKRQALATVKDDAKVESADLNFAELIARNSDFVAIETCELTKDFGEFRAVDSVSLRVQEGKIFGLLGANGAGKTTVIKILTGIMPPTKGSGSIAGADIARLGPSIKQRIGYMSQQFSLYMDLTVIENIMLYAGIYGLRAKEARERCHWIGEMAGLSGDIRERTSNLPVGMRQRLALGCALVHRPRVLFLDEPTSGIDPVGRQHFWELLFELSRSEGVTILLTTHYMSEAEHCDHLGLMHAGKLVADASPEALKREVENEAGQLLEIAVSDADSAIQRLTEIGFKNSEMYGQHIHLMSKTPQQDAYRIREELNGLQVSSVRILDLSMDDVFVYKIRALERLADTGLKRMDR